MEGEEGGERGEGGGESRVVESGVGAGIEGMGWSDEFPKSVFVRMKTKEGRASGGKGGEREKYEKVLVVCT